MSIFNGNKIITTGGGGAILTQNKSLAKKRYLISQAKDDPIYFVHNEVGYNYKCQIYMRPLVWLR